MDNQRQEPIIASTGCVQPGQWSCTRTIAHPPLHRSCVVQWNKAMTKATKGLHSTWSDNKDVLPSALACEVVGGAAPDHTRADDDDAAGLRSHQER